MLYFIRITTHAIKVRQT